MEYSVQLGYDVFANLLAQIGFVVLAVLLSMLFKGPRRIADNIRKNAVLHDSIVEIRTNFQKMEVEHNEMYDDFKINSSDVVVLLREEVNRLKSDRQSKMEDLLEKVARDVSETKTIVTRVDKLEQNHKGLQQEYKKLHELVKNNISMLEKLESNQQKAA